MTMIDVITAEAFKLFLEDLKVELQAIKQKAVLLNSLVYQLQDRISILEKKEVNDGERS